MSHEVDGIVNATSLEERKHRISFSDPFMHDPKALICLKSVQNSKDFS